MANVTHAATSVANRAYCGRKEPGTKVWHAVTCRECLAARRADLAAKGR